MRAARALLYKGDLGGMERTLLTAMWLKAGASGVCFATYSELADLIGCSIKSVQRGARGLAKRGLASGRYVQRGEELLPGVVAMSPRTVFTLKELPVVDVHGLNGCLTQVFEQNLCMKGKPMKTAPLSVLAVLFVHANQKGETYVGVERVAKLLKMNSRTVARHMQDLEQAGHLATRLGRVPGPSGYPQVIRTLTPGRGPRFTADISDRGRGQERAPKEIHQADPLRAPPPPPPPPGQLTFAVMHPATVAMEAHERICKAPAGDGAVELVKVMLSEGLTPQDLGKAFAGVMTMAYRRERLVRREIGSVLQTKAQAISFIKRVDPERAEQIEKNVPAPPSKAELESRSQDVRALFAKPRPTFC